MSSAATADQRFTNIRINTTTPTSLMSRKAAHERLAVDVTQPVPYHHTTYARSGRAGTPMLAPQLAHSTLHHHVHNPSERAAAAALADAVRASGLLQLDPASLPQPGRRGLFRTSGEVRVELQELGTWSDRFGRTGGGKLVSTRTWTAPADQLPPQMADVLRAARNFARALPQEPPEHGFDWSGSEREAVADGWRRERSGWRGPGGE